MKIRKAAAADEEAVKSLWGYCFEKPSDPFFGWYFSKIYRAEEVLLGEEGGEVACDLHRRPYALQVRGLSYPVDYIVGVATHPAARGKGCAKELLRGAFHLANQEGKSLVVLMPSAASFYLPLGFGFCVHQWERKAAPQELSALGKRATSCCMVQEDSRWQELDFIYKAYTRNRNGYALREEVDWKRLIAGALLEGYIALVYDEKGPAGYLMYTLDDRQMTVSEMAFASEAGRKGLYAFMAGHQGSIDTCLWYEPLDDTSFRYWNDGAEHCYIRNQSFPFLLARVTDPVTAFDGLPCDSSLSGEMAFQLVDSFLPENSGLYILKAENGHIRALKEDVFYSLKCHIEDIAGVKLGNHIPDPVCSISAAALAEWLLGAADFSELLSLEKIHWLISAEKQEQIQKWADALLPKQKNWMNEWY